MSETSDALFARYLSGECSTDEKAAVEELIAADPEKQRIMATMSTVWNTSEPQPVTSDLNGMWHDIAEKTGVTVPPVKTRSHDSLAGCFVDWFQPHSVRRYAAAAVLLIATSVAFYGAREAGVFSFEQRIEWVELAVESGAHRQLNLSDGTRIRLDAGSVLEYPMVFNGEERAVRLSGEGYFEVASRADQPFVVRADDARIRVLGTQFNVRAWQGEQRVTVAVAEGKVSFGADEDGSQDVEIEKGEMSVLPKDGLPTKPRAVEIMKHLGWLHREAFFDGVPLNEILHQLERWYDVRFITEDTAIAAEQLTLHIDAESLQGVLELISALTDLEYQRTDGVVRLTSKD